MENITLICEEGGIRIDKYINIDGITRAMVQKLIENGSITVNGNPTKNNYKLKAGDRIEIVNEEPKDANIEAEDIAPVSLPGKIPWTEEPGGLQSMGSQRVGHD